MGSAAAMHLARRGVQVLGFEQFPSGHDRGSSHGHSRIIRTAYYEHPDYIPLVRRSFELWRQLEAESGRRLLTPCDCLSLGPADGALIRGLDVAARILGPGAVESLSSNEVHPRYPFRVPGEYEARLEHEAGVLFVEECVQAQWHAARAAGADLREQEPVLDWQADDRGVQVRTASSEHSADMLVITAGPWASHMLGEIGVPLTVMRQTMHWFAPQRPEAFTPERFPVFMCETPGGDFYGLPAVAGRGPKIARHYGASEVDSPAMVSRTLSPEDEIPVRNFLDDYLPGCVGSAEAAQVCIYTLTPDRHFVIDRHPRHGNVLLAAGFSGHGFKFAPVVGEILADLAHAGRTPHRIDRFTAARDQKP